ncbi:RtcB family protein [Dactylosporangium sp. NPDC051484]|uniref:RtcB family protein n=1 Tax=Dactylosporangium sp. NPDC051484 TaxID=3154942 RepID=UPI00344E0022
MVTVVADGVCRWRIEPAGAMRVPGVVFATAGLLPDAPGDQALRQVADVATLPGIVEASYAMPDVHWGYGFPIGGVAATDPALGGVISPGGVGFDISCGVRLLTSTVTRAEAAPHAGRLMDLLGAATPRGMGRGGVLPAAQPAELDAILLGGSAYAVERGFGVPEDLTFCEDGGAVSDADPGAVSARALERGRGQLGSLGSGNHFLEVQAVDSVFDERVAGALGLRPGLLCLMIHCGSRGLGHQICSDHVRVMLTAMGRYGIHVPDPQLACAPVTSPEGTAYLAAMAAAANYGRANRQLLTHAARRCFRDAGLGELRLLYDVSHNLAKLETHTVDGVARRLCVHRKGATRAFPPGHPDLSGPIRPVGQPVLVPGSMGTASYVLVGVADGQALHSACHGAGRTLSRHAAVRQAPVEAVRRELAAAGVLVRGASDRGLAEEAPEAYKDVDEVVRTCRQARLADPVARLVPVGVVKG